MELEDVNRETGEVKVRHGKRQKQRLVYLGAGGREAIEGWLRFRGEAPGPLLRAAEKGGRISEGALPADSIYRIVKSAAKRSAVKEFSPHDLRRTFVSGLLEARADISVVKEMAGHASVSTTVRYDRRGERAKKKAAELRAVPPSMQISADSSGGCGARTPHGVRRSSPPNWRGSECPRSEPHPCRPAPTDRAQDPASSRVDARRVDRTVP